MRRLGNVQRTANIPFTPISKPQRWVMTPTPTARVGDLCECSCFFARNHPEPRHSKTKACCGLSYQGHTLTINHCSLGIDRCSLGMERGHSRYGPMLARYGVCSIAMDRRPFTLEWTLLVWIDAHSLWTDTMALWITASLVWTDTMVWMTDGQYGFVMTVFPPKGAHHFT